MPKQSVKAVMERACGTALRPTSWCRILKRWKSSTARMRNGEADSKPFVRFLVLALTCQGLKRNVSIIAEAAAATNGSAGSGTVAGTVEAITRKAILTVGCDKRAAVKQALDSDAGCLGCFAYPWRTPIVFSVEFRSLNLSISL